MTRVAAIAIIVTFARAAAADVALHGRVVDAKTAEPLAGATVIASSADGDQVAITDEAGRYELVVPETANLVTFFYLDHTIQRVLAIARGGHPIELAPQAISSENSGSHGCYFGPPPMTGESRFSVGTDDGWPIARVRDATAITALVAAPAGPVVVDGARRFAAAPAVALGLLADATAVAERGPYDGGARARETSLSTRQGSNSLHAAARIAYGTDGAAAEAGAGGPIVTDRVWWWGGGVVGPGGDQELAKLAFAATSEHQGRVEYLRASAPGVAIPGARVIAGTTTDDFVDASWQSKLDDRRVELDAGVTAERLDAGGQDTTRGAGRAAIVVRKKWLGYQHLTATGELGGGRAGDVGHRDAAGSLADNWQLLPNLTIAAGARWDERWFGAASAQAWQPRAMVSWDWTKEARGDLFVGAARSSTLDLAGPATPIAWAHARDDVIAGVRYELAGEWLVGIGGRAANELGAWRAGVDAEVRHHKRWVDLHVTASSIDRAVAGLARFEKGRGDNELVATVNGRLSEIDRSIGASVGWRRRHHHQPKTTVALEGIADRVGVLARVVIAAEL